MLGAGGTEGDRQPSCHRAVCLEALLGATLWWHAKREQCSPVPGPGRGSNEQRHKDEEHRTVRRKASLLGVAASPWALQLRTATHRRMEEPQLTGLRGEQPQGLLRKLTLDPPILGSLCHHGRVTKDISSKAEVDGFPSWYTLRSKKSGGLEA